MTHSTNTIHKKKSNPQYRLALDVQKIYNRTWNKQQSVPSLLQNNR
ncbi:3434_t:CDS:1, partial [Acaulospora colombiana]